MSQLSGCLEHAYDTCIIGASLEAGLLRPSALQPKDLIACLRHGSVPVVCIVHIDGGHSDCGGLTELMLALGWAQEGGSARERPLTGSSSRRSVGM